MPPDKENRKAEIKLLAALANKPEKIFDIDSVWITRDDFYHEGCRCIYSAILSLATTCKSIDNVVLETKIAQLFKPYYDQKSEEFGRICRKLFKIKPIENIEEYVRIIVTNATKRRANRHLHSMLHCVDKSTDHNEILNTVENKTVQFTAGQLRNVDVSCLSDKYNIFIEEQQKMFKEGRKIGISSGYKNYDILLGGGFRRSAVDIVAARAKVGKSILGINIAYNVASRGIPVLYLDTELTWRIQLSRLLSVMSGVPIRHLETGGFFGKLKYAQRIKKIKKRFQKLPLSYVEIKGWNIQKQISTIRSWFARNVGKDEDGRTKDALIVLDYIKIMDRGDFQDAKEYQALGFQLTALHDLMGELDSSMFAMVQENRLGLDEHHEGSVGGSDRISQYCDSLSFLMARKAEELRDDYENPDRDEDVDPYNMKLLVRISRFGGNNPSNESISLYSDIKNPRKKRMQVRAKITEYGIENYRPPERRRGQ
jgi:replicative DNA helicase